MLKKRIRERENSNVQQKNRWSIRIERKSILVISVDGRPQSFHSLVRYQECFKLIEKLSDIFEIRSGKANPMWTTHPKMWIRLNDPRCVNDPSEVAWTWPDLIDPNYSIIPLTMIPHNKMSQILIIWAISYFIFLFQNYLLHIICNYWQ